MMKHCLGKAALCLAILASSFFVVTNTAAQSRTPFSKNKVLEVSSISATVGKGEVSFSKGETPKTLKTVVNGTVPTVEGKMCLWCFETIRIDPNRKIPTVVFTERSSNELESFKAEGEIVKNLQLETYTVGGKEYRRIKQPFVVESVGLDSVIIEIPPLPKATEFIVSGAGGATLRKKGKGFLLVEGEAHLLQTKVEAAAKKPKPAAWIKLSAEVRQSGKDQIKLNVVRGTYKLKNGVELRVGGRVYVYESVLAFPEGLMIEVGKGGVTLGGKAYTEGTRLTVEKDGAIVLWKLKGMK